MDAPREPREVKRESAPRAILPSGWKGLWGFTQFLLWMAGIAIPVSVGFFIWGTFFNPFETSDSMCPISSTEIGVYRAIPWFFFSATGLMLILLRKRVRGGFNWQVFIFAMAWCVTPIIGISVSAHCQELFIKNLQDDLYAGHVQITVVDAETGRALDPHLAGATRHEGDPFSGSSDLSSPGVPGEEGAHRVVLTFYATKPMPITLWAEGYEEQQIHVGRDSDEIVVRLNREKPPPSSAADSATPEQPR